MNVELDSQLEVINNRKCKATGDRKIASTRDRLVLGTRQNIYGNRSMRFQSISSQNDSFSSQYTSAKAIDLVSLNGVRQSLLKIHYEQEFRRLICLAGDNTAWWGSRIRARTKRRR